MTGKAVRQLRDLLGPLDPVRGVPSPTGPQQRQEALDMILSQHAGGDVARRRRRPALVAAGAITVIVGVVAAMVLTVLSRDQAPAYAATPIPLIYHYTGRDEVASNRLHELAAISAAVPGFPVGKPVEYLRISSWNLNSLIDGHRTTSTVVPEQRESWRRIDNSGRVRQRYLPPVFSNSSEQVAWRQEGSPGAAARPRTSDFPSGQFPARWPDRPPTNAAALARWLRPDGPPTTDALAGLTAATDLLRERVLTGAERAAVIRFLAQLPDLETAGDVTDRAGRRGQGFTLDSDSSGVPTNYTIILDDEGRFLAFEQMLTTTAGKLNVEIPAVIGYETYLAAEYVESVA